MGIVESIGFFIFVIIFLFCFFWPISLPLLIIYIVKRKKNRKQFKAMNISYKKEYKDIDYVKLQGFDTNISNLKMYLYDIFLKFENAYNNLDFNTMYNLCTERMYDMYHTNITLNLKFEEKKIIDQIKIEKMIVYDVFASEFKQIVYTLIKISSISYTQKTNGKIVSGSPTKPITESFEVTFIKTFKQKDKYKCPNCGASVNGSQCEYCQSKIDNSGDFRIDSIKKIV